MITATTHSVSCYLGCRVTHGCLESILALHNRLREELRGGLAWHYVAVHHRYGIFRAKRLDDSAMGLRNSILEAGGHGLSTRGLLL
jgi:hypothetical protein